MFFKSQNLLYTMITFAWCIKHWVRYRWPSRRILNKLLYDSIIYYEWIHRLECLRCFYFKDMNEVCYKLFKRKSHLVFVNSHQNALVRKKCPALVDQIVFLSTISSIYLRERSKMNYISKSEINFVRTMMYYHSRMSKICHKK